MFIFKEKIESTPSDPYLRFHDPRLFQPWNLLVLQEVPGDVVGSMGVEHDGMVLSLHGDDGVACLPPMRFFSDETDNTSR